jgi:predicted dinucleotide-binding enzyme
MEESMKIAILGAGNVGGTLGRRWANAGHSITFGVRDPSAPKIQGLVDEIGVNARAKTVKEAARDADAIALCLPWNAVRETLLAVGDLSGRLLIDVTNPIALTPEGLRQGLLLGHTTSGGEQVAEWAPGAHVVKAFNTTGWQNMANPSYAGRPLSIMLCGDENAAKNTVAGLARDIGFEPADVGPLRSARYLEAVAMLYVDMGIFQGYGTDFAFQIVKR